jgi:hypothetical protein
MDLCIILRDRLNLCIILDHRDIRACDRFCCTLFDYFPLKVKKKMSNLKYLFFVFLFPSLQMMVILNGTVQCRMKILNLI